MQRVEQISRDQTSSSYNQSLERKNMDRAIVSTIGFVMISSLELTFAASSADLPMAGSTVNQLSPLANFSDTCCC